MYSIRPYHDFASEVVSSTCMYNMRAVCKVGLQLAAATVSKGGNYEKLLEKQNKLLEQLQLLQIDMSKELSQQKSPTNCITEVVLCMDPSNPSTSILLAQSILSSSHPILISSFNHSSVSSSDNLKVKVKSSPYSHDRNDYEYGITYIWKKGAHLPSLILHPSHQVSICGEGNIIKFLFSLIHHPPPLSPLQNTIFDDIIDSVQSYNLTGSPTLEVIVDGLNSAVPSSTSSNIFGGEDTRAVDVVLWSALKGSNKSSKNLPSNLQGWFENFSRKHAARGV